jgi:hypothetical protein
MIPAIFLTIVMILVSVAIPITLWYLVNVKRLHLPKEEQNEK